ncbi:MAG: endonuclease [Thermogutta sp.]|nr:endonuclease [Thermogutta sp.]
MDKKTRYSRLIEAVFLSRSTPGAVEIPFERDDLVRIAQQLNVRLPKNLGDVIYSFRYRAALPKSVRSKAPEGKEWVIRPAGHAKYCFVAVKQAVIRPSKLLAETKVLDATPGVIAKYALSDEQALLAKLRYNRLIDIFTGAACYSLQNHLRTSVPKLGRIETDEVYIGLDKKGVHYVFPVQAKGGNDHLSSVQIEQDIAMCENKFPSLLCRPIGARFLQDGLIALFEFEPGKEGIRVVAEKHYHLVPPEELTDADLRTYQGRPD